VDGIIIVSKDVDSHMQHVEEALSRLVEIIYLFALQIVNGAKQNLEISSFSTQTFRKPYGNYSLYWQNKGRYGLACSGFRHGRAQLLGFLKCHRRHLLNLLKIARPLHELTKHSTLPD
jgi:hypothetical protein